MILKNLNKTGDTIVEVLIATAIVSLILGGAYATSNRSLKTTRQAEERVEAVKHTESQLEKLRVAAPNPAVNFCFAADGSLASFSAGPPPAITSADDFTKYPTAGGGTGCLYTTGGVTYHVWITKSTTTTASVLPITLHTYTVHTRWPSYGTSINDEVTLTYRIDK